MNAIRPKSAAGPQSALLETSGAHAPVTVAL
jgi:hypothetical protein